MRRELLWVKLAAELREDRDRENHLDFSEFSRIILADYADRDGITPERNSVSSRGGWIAMDVSFWSPGISCKGTCGTVTQKAGTPVTESLK